MRHRLTIATALTIGLLAAALPSTAVIAAPAPAPAITASATTVKVGDSVTITGTKFPKRATGTVAIGSSSVAFTASGSGWFSSTVVIPSVPNGPLTVTARAGSATASLTLSVATPPAPEPVASTLQFGVATPGGATANAELDAVSSLVGERPSLVLWYEDFAQPAPIAKLDSVAARGATSVITWEPWRWGAGTSQPDYASARIAAGAHDSYIRQWATALATWGKPVMLRYGHEMNGSWYPWADGVNGNAPGDYAAAWRHVHDVFAAAGASNVSWVWSPNVPYPGSTALPGLYPGAAYVDVVALDGYNWGTTRSDSRWTSPAELFTPGLTELRTLAPGIPILIAETASAEAGGSKAEWNTALISFLSQQADVTGFVWFHYAKETDWRIDSSSTSATALRDALAARRS